MTHIELYREIRTGPGDGAFEIPLDEPGDFRWRMVHTNGNVVAASTQGYADKRDMIWNLKFVTGGRFDHAGTVLKRRYLTVNRNVRGDRWQKFEIRDLTKGDS